MTSNQIELQLPGLAALSVSGTTLINTDTVTSTGAQTYGDAVTLGTNITLTASTAKLTINATTTWTVRGNWSERVAKRVSPCGTEQRPQARRSRLRRAPARV